MRFHFYIAAAVLLFVQHETAAQYVLKGKVVEDSTARPLEGVRCYIAGSQFHVQTDAEGKFALELPPNTRNLRLRCELFGYSPRAIPLDSLLLTPSLFLDIQLSPTWKQLKEVEIVARSTPDTVWGSDFQNVADFALLDDQLLLLVYQSEQRWKRQEEKDKTLYRNAQLVLLGKQGEELNRLSVPGEAIQLHLACTDDVFLEGRSAFYHVMVDDNNLRLESMDYEVYRNQMEPVIDTLGNLTIFSTYNEAYPAFEYMTFNRVDSSMHTLRCIINEEVMETFRSEYKYLPPRQKLEAFRYQVKTGIDKEIVAAYMTGFQNSAYYEPVNAPLFVMNDTLLIFDHHHDQLLRMDKDGETIDSMMIGYHHSVRPEKWSGRLLSDKETKEIYTVYDRSGKNVLKKINVHSGEATSSFELTYRYADKLQVVNGWAYYIWRPFESAQHRFLYKEKL